MVTTSPGSKRLGDAWRISTVKPHLGHDHVLALLHVFALGLDDGVEEVEVLDVAAVRGQAVDEVLQDALWDLAAQLVVVTEDVLHCLRLQQLQTEEGNLHNLQSTCSDLSNWRNILDLTEG